MTTLVLGIGNPLRGDDAAGWVLAELLAARQLPGVEVRSLPQLQVELVEDWSRHDRVVVLDAAVSGEPVLLERLEAGATGIPSLDQPDEVGTFGLGRPAEAVRVSASAGRPQPGVPTPSLRCSEPPNRSHQSDLGASHALSPRQLLALTRILHSRVPETYVCAVRADGFELGAGLSPGMEIRVQEALRQLVNLLTSSNSNETIPGGGVS